MACIIDYNCVYSTRQEVVNQYSVHVWIMTTPMQACMILNISPLEENLPESVSTLEFGQNVRQTELGKATKHITKAVV